MTTTRATQGADEVMETAVFGLPEVVESCAVLPEAVDPALPDVKLAVLPDVVDPLLAEDVLAGVVAPEVVLSGSADETVDTVLLEVVLATFPELVVEMPLPGFVAVKDVASTLPE
jgi:hypothetical protein